MRLQKITRRWAGKHQACDTKRFFNLFPDGLDLTDKAQVKKAWRLIGLQDVQWFLSQIGIRVPCRVDGTDTPFLALPLSGEFEYTKRELRPYAKKAGLPL